MAGSDATVAEVCLVIDQALALAGRGRGFERDTPLLGALPELDSVAVVDLISALEARFGIVLADEDLSAEMFGTVGDLADAVDERRAVRVQDERRW